MSVPIRGVYTIYTLSPGWNHSEWPGLPMGLPGYFLGSPQCPLVLVAVATVGASLQLFTYSLLLSPISQPRCCFMRLMLLSFQVVSRVKESSPPTYSSQLVLGSHTTTEGIHYSKVHDPVLKGTGGISLVLPLDTLCSYFINCKWETAD